MAETLAQAVLEVGVDDSRLRAGLQGVERQAAATGAEISRRFTASGREILTAANGLEYFIDALGRARRENGQFVTATERLAAGIGGPGGFGGLGGASGIRGLELGFGNLADAALKAAGAIGLFTSAWEAINFAIQQNIALDNAGAAVRTLGVNSADLEGKLRSLSTELNNNISTVDLLKASYDVASSGFANAADATEVLKAAALGATGGFSNINTVADATTSVLNAYGLAASNATKLVDGFIQTQNDGKIIIGQYAQEIGRVAPIAAAAGVSIKELNAAVSVATAQGVPVGSTFAGLRQAISSILKPTSEATELAGALGLAFNAQALKAKGLGQFLKDIEEKTGGAADALTKLFGSVEAVAAVQPLLNDGLVKFNNNLDSQTSKSGQAADAADKASNTLSGSVKRLQNSLSDLVTSTNESLQPLAKFINLIAEGTKLVPSLGEGIKKNLVPALGIFEGINKNLDGIVQKLGLLPELEALKGGIQGGIAGLGQDLSRIAEEYRIALGGQAGVGPEELVRFEKELADLRDQRAKKDAQAREDASFAFQNAERDIVRPAREQLEIAQRLSGLDGERLRQSRQQLIRSIEPQPSCADTFQVHAR
jgi:TP901 family phage tail tape measure protein